MEIIDLDVPITPAMQAGGPIVLALGFFDGVHRGHQAVIARARQVAEARGLKLAVMTFNVHPAVIYQHVPENEVRYLSTRRRKIELMDDLGVDVLYFAHFTPTFSRLKPQQFVDSVLVALHAQVVVAGFDYTYGPHDIADMRRLPEYAKGRFDIIAVPEASDAVGKISSTRIREALDTGDIKLANDLLGYRYRTTGIVVHGEARGRELGFPTANIETPGTERLPGIGIYTVRMQVNGHWYGGMASIGRNITFGEHREVTLEINLFDFDADIYDRPVTVEWLAYQRGEVKFSGAEALIEQLKQDEKQARANLQEQH